MVILALPEQNNQCMLLWELMGNRRTEERDGSEIYLKKNTDKENTYSVKKIWLFLRWCEMKSEKILNRKSLQHWWRTEPSFCRGAVMQTEKLTHSSVKLENCNLSSVARLTWDEIQALCSVLAAPTHWVLRNDPMHVSDLPNLRSYSKLWFRGHHHGLHWNNQPVHYFKELKGVLGKETSLHLPFPTVFATLPSLNPDKVSSCWLLKCSPLARFGGHGYRKKVWHYLSRLFIY